MPISRDQLAADYLEQLPFEPYPVQEEALLSWFTTEQGVLVCAPTGTGKTLIAEAAVFEALHNRETIYYTTPLIALTDQKFQELQDSAVRWGFDADDVGLVTGNRQVNPKARVLVVVAEILLNRLLHPTAFDFEEVSAVVMDEFHSFNDYERGIVWEFSLGLLPKSVRLLLLSATVGNSQEFVNWLAIAHKRKIELVQSSDRKVPLTFQWVGDQLLGEQIELMASGEEPFTPALIFCFNREMCWNVADQLKGKKLLADGQQKRLSDELKQYDWSEGAGPKLRQILLRGVGVHHAGVLPRYRRIVENLFQQKLLSVTVCTETLSAGINLPARSVVVPNLLKGPPGDKKLLEASSAHQMFGRAGRPQFDTQGFVFGMAHEDDVKIARWRVKYDQIPEDTKDPGLRKAKKALKKKMPKRRSTEQYWGESQFEQLRNAPASNLSSRGPLPWRMLAFMLDASPDVELVRKLVGRRLLRGKQAEHAQKSLDRMLLTLWRAGYVRLEPEPPRTDSEGDQPSEVEVASKPKPGSLQDFLGGEVKPEPPPVYQPKFAHPTESMQKLLLLRGVNPLYGVYLMNQLGVADRNERLQAMESILELPRSIGPAIRVPSHEDLPPGPLAMIRIDPQLLSLGLATAAQLGAASDEEEEEEPRSGMFAEERVWVLTLAEKLRMLFHHDFPDVDVRVWPVWAAGEVLEFGGDFNKYVTSKRLQKQEGVVFRHLLRLILLIQEFKQFHPPDVTSEEWEADLSEISDALAETCRNVDPESTNKMLADASQRPSL